MSDRERQPRFVTDTHSHPIASGHAYNTVEEMAKAAADRGLLALAITDHGPKMPGSCDAMYFRNFKIIDRFRYGVELLMGCELNIMDYDGTLDLSEKDFQQLDITIASIHTICYTVGTKAENMRAYRKAMENPLVDIIGHPDDGRVPVDYEELVRCAKETGKLLELNNSSLDPKNARENGYENMKRMLGFCEKYGVSVTLGSDAHFCDRAGCFDDVQALLTEIRFPEELVVSTSVEKLKSRLHRFASL